MSHSTIGKIKTSSGIWFDFNDPQEDQVEIHDIAHALSMICRYNGHIPSFYSVAEHSCHVADWLDVHGHGHLAFAGLLHDTAEAYLGDIVNPMKRLYEFDRVYAPMEEIVETVIGKKFNVDMYPIDPIVKEADKAVYQWEIENIRTGKIKGYSQELAYETFIAFFNHYQPTKESQMTNHIEVPRMTDDELDAQTAAEVSRKDAYKKAFADLSHFDIAEEAEISWNEEAEQRLMRDIADVDASVAEDLTACHHCGEFTDELNVDGLCMDCLDAHERVHAEKMPWGPRRGMLMSAADLVDGDRNAQYGDPRQDFQRTAKYWNAHIEGVIDRKLAASDGRIETSSVLEPQDVAIMMSLLKVSRLAWDPTKEDTWIDVAGYAACGWHCAVDS